MHRKYMKMALSLSMRNLGITAPNPSVGCVIVKDGIIVGRGWTARGGRPHAETIALKQAGENANGASMYVSLEPCCNHGKTPPCTDAIIKAGIAKIMIATVDSNPEIAGKGIQLLQKANIKVGLGMFEDESEEINKGFFLTKTDNRPLVALKFATSLDGKIALATGESKWITSETSREYGHFLRSKYDAIMVGIGTVLADDPMLNCRLKGLEDRSPIRIVMDTNLKIPLDSKLVKTANEIPVWVFCSCDKDDKKEELEKKGVQVFDISEDTKYDNQFLLTKLAKNGITRLLVEGGATLATSFVKKEMFDEIYWFKSPQIMGGDSVSSINALDIKYMTNSRPLKTVEVKQFNNDIMVKLCRK